MTPRERQRPEEPAEGQAIFSERLAALMDDILEGRAPNAGRFCGHCYHPLAQGRPSCPYCHRPVDALKPARHIPEEVLGIYRAQRLREGWTVHAIAWGGLALGVVLGLLPLALKGATWWTVLSFLGILGFFYILSANVANTLGDALGYRWGQRVARRRWERFVARREGGPGAL